MNRALQGKHLHVEDEHHSIMKKGKQQYYGVQSKNHIWWMAAFELPHETHDTLAWYFEQMGLPNFFQQQNSGQKLHVDGVGSLNVEWHLARDLKTLECMLGYILRANTLFPCIYSCNIKVDPNARPKQKGSQRANGKKAKDNNQTGSKSSMQWFAGIMSCNQSTPPNRDKHGENWKPVLPIALERVHLCTLHARLRILDKLLKLHINSA